MDIVPGLHINPNVKLVRPLGQGGMGSVWVAEHLTLRTEVAVKFIDPELAKLDPSMLTRFEREASTAAQIKSPHVVQMLDHGVTGATPYIVMELLEGESLEERLHRSGRLSVDEVEVLLTQCAKALTKAHSLGIIHRDLKPANLFLIESGYDIFVKVLDFGIAKQTGIVDLKELTGSMAVVGTPMYMSLEQLISTKDVSHSTDLWALAVIAYQALTGALPYESDTLPGLTMKVLEGAFKPVSVLNPSLPVALDTWFERGLQKEAADRFATADELARTFTQVIRGSALQPPSRDGANAPPVDLGATTVMDEVAVIPAVPQQPVVVPAPVMGPVATPAPTMAQAPSPAAGVLLPQSGSTVSALTSDSRRAPPSSPWMKVALAATISLGLVGASVAFVVMRADTQSPASTNNGSATNEEPLPKTTSDDSASAQAASPAPTLASATPTVEASSAPSPSTAPSPPTAPNPPTWQPPPPRPSPAPEPPRPKTKPSYCNGTSGFYRNAQGRLVPKPECL